MYLFVFICLVALQGCLSRLSVSLVQSNTTVLVITLLLCGEVLLVLLSLCLCVQTQGRAHKTRHTVIVRQSDREQYRQPVSEMCTQSDSDRSARADSDRCIQPDSYRFTQLGVDREPGISDTHEDNIQFRPVKNQYRGGGTQPII